MQYSKAGKPYKWARIDKLTLGFSQWGTLTANITFGKMDGFQSQRSDDYDSLLDDAKSTHIILHDTSHKRAFQTNAEDLILHIIQHQRSQNTSGIETPPAAGKVEGLLSAHPDRRVTSTREAMLCNAEKVFSIRHQLSSPALRKSLFKDEVKLLWTTIDGLWAHSFGGDGGKSPLKMSLHPGQAVSGWEYMDIVNIMKHMDPKSTDLRKTCGRWNDYAKDIKAIVLFGAGFGDVFKPAALDAVCSTFETLPRDECYLAVQANTLMKLFIRQGSLQDQEKLTNSGLALLGPKRLFKPCDLGKHARGVKCNSQYVVRLVDQSAFRKEHARIPLEDNRDGVIIVGGTKDGFLSVLHRQPTPQPVRRQLRDTPRQERQASYRGHQTTTSTLTSDPDPKAGFSSVNSDRSKFRDRPIQRRSNEKQLGDSSLKPYWSPKSNYGDSSLESADSSRRRSGLSSGSQPITSLTSVSSSNGIERGRSPCQPEQPLARTWSSVAASGISSVYSGSN